MTRFCSAVDFAIQHLNGIRIAKISWGFAYYMRYNTSPKYWKSFAERAYKEQDRDWMNDVCNRFAFRFQDQLLCFVSPLFHLTSDCFFPVLRHLTLMSVSQDIRSMFQTVTPKLVSLLVESDWYTGNDIHPDNFKHLPADFRCISLPQTSSDESLLHLLRCRKTIQSIRFTGTLQEYAQTARTNYPILFPSLNCLKFRIEGREIRENILTVNAAGLQHLQLKASYTEYFRRLPSHVIFHNLKTLIIDCDWDFLQAILSRTSHRLEQLIVTWCYGVKGRNFLTKLSEIKFLTMLKITFSMAWGPDPVAEQSFTDSVLMLLRGESRSTLKHFKFASCCPIGDIPKGEIASELRLMQESESLESGIVQDEWPCSDGQLEL